MKQFFTTLSTCVTSFFNGLAQARAASAAARMHKYEEAARIMEDKKS